MKVRDMALTSLFAALTAVGALVYIPLPISPVPITLQLFFTFLAGALLGKKLGFMSQIVYLLLGAVGLPVFAGGVGGIGALFGPTAGFLYGFLIAGYISGLGKREFKSKILYLGLSLIVIYLLGLGGLMLNTGMGIKKAFMAGVAPFIIGDILKLILASYLAQRIPIDNLN